MSILIIITILLGPLMASLLYFYIRYRFKKGDFVLFYRAYFWGILSVVVPALVYLILYLQGYTELTNLRRILFYSFVGVGLGHELGKFIILRYLILPSPSFRSPSDGVLYSLMINFGSISLLSILSLILFPEISPKILIANLFVSIVFSVVMGFFVGMGKIRQNRLVDSSTGLISAAFFHGSYQFILETKDFKLMILFLAGSSIITLLLLFKAISITDQVKSDKSVP
jgi:RsiW-degrading membrane proteinase PrsW (M82 family)